MISKNQINAINNVAFKCGGLKHDDDVLILCDITTRQIANEFYKCIASTHSAVSLLEIPELPNHGAEPSVNAKVAMCSASLILCLCKYSLAHTRARLDAASAGARFLSLPLYDFSLLEDESLRIDYHAQSQRVRNFANAFTLGREIHITSSAGTDIKLRIDGRKGNYCPGLVVDPGDLGSPPDIEANISPLEGGSNGVVVVDGSITMPGFGLLSDPVVLEVRAGKVVEFRSANARYVEVLNQIFGDVNSLRRVVAECGVGLNPAAKLTGSMLTDEGALGCMHFGLGSNSTVGGMNEVDFHLDFVFKQSTLSVDGKKLIDLGTPLI